jgi:hypothetical protein
MWARKTLSGLVNLWLYYPDGLGNKISISSPVCLPYMVIMDLLISVLMQCISQGCHKTDSISFLMLKTKKCDEKMCRTVSFIMNTPQNATLMTILKYSTADISLWQLCLHWPPGLASTLYHKSSKTITYRSVQIYILAVHTYILYLCILLLRYWLALSAQNLVKNCRHI